MDSESQMITNEINRTRARLTDKLEAIENQVIGTVQEATTAVRDTVHEATNVMRETVDDVKETVHEAKETVTETAHAVKESFDLKTQVDRHPYGMLAGAVAAGYVAGMLLNPPAYAATPSRPASSSGGGGGIADHPEVSALKGLAVALAMGVLKNMVTEALPKPYGGLVQQLFGGLHNGQQQQPQNQPPQYQQHAAPAMSHPQPPNVYNPHRNAA